MGHIFFDWGFYVLLFALFPVSLCIVFLIPMTLFGQGTGKVWTETGVKGSLTKKLDWGVELTTRFGANGVETFFPQVSLKYKVSKWARVSVDYRAISDKNKYGNYHVFTHNIILFNLI